MHLVVQHLAVYLVMVPTDKVQATLRRIIGRKKKDQ